MTRLKADMWEAWGAGRRRHYHHEANGQVQRGCSPENSDFLFMILAIHPGLEGELNLKNHLLGRQPRRVSERPSEEAHADSFSP